MRALRENLLRALEMAELVLIRERRKRDITVRRPAARSNVVPMIFVCDRTGLTLAIVAVLVQNGMSHHPSPYGSHNQDPVICALCWSSTLTMLTCYMPPCNARSKWT